MPVTLAEVLNNAELPPQVSKALLALMPRFIKVVLSPALIAQGTSAEQTFTVNGLAVGDFVYVSKPTTQAGLVIGGARVSAANTLAITFGNIPNAGGNITPTASETYLVLQVPANLNPQANTLP